MKLVTFRGPRSDEDRLGALIGEDQVLDLTAVGGEPAFASMLALIEAESELKTLKRICDNERFRVEANDMAAEHRLA